MKYNDGPSIDIIKCYFVRENKGVQNNFTKPIITTKPDHLSTVYTFFA